MEGVLELEHETLLEQLPPLHLQLPLGKEALEQQHPPHSAPADSLGGHTGDTSALSSGRLTLSLRYIIIQWLLRLWTQRVPYVTVHFKSLTYLEVLHHTLVVAL